MRYEFHISTHYLKWKRGMRIPSSMANAGSQDRLAKRPRLEGFAFWRSLIGRAGLGKGYLHRIGLDTKIGQLVGRAIGAEE